MGGLARKATILNDYNDNDLFVVDAGNLFFSSDLIDDGVSKEVAKLNADIILNSFNEMGCTAFSPGSKDFALGKKFIKSLSQKASFPFISSNIFDSNGKLLFEPYIIKEIKGMKIAFIGLSSVFESDGLIVKEPISVLRELMDDLKFKTDIRVLLFSSNDLDMKQLKALNLDLSMIIRSRNKQRSSDGGNGIPTYTLGDKGKILYKFDLEINDSDLEFTDIAWCDRTIKDSNSRLDKMKKGDMLVDLEKLFKDNPSALKRVFLYQSRIEEANQRLENAINKIVINKIELGKNISGNVDILKIVDDGKLEINKLGVPQRHKHDHDGDGYPDH